MLARALSADREVAYGAAFALALAGHTWEAQAIADDIEQRFPEATCVRCCYLPTLRAQLALNRAEATKALSLLETVVPYELGVHESTTRALFGALYATYVRGEVYLALHRDHEATIEFQKILDRSGIVLSDPVGIVARLQLARAFARSGNQVRRGPYTKTYWSSGRTPTREFQF